MKEVAVLDVSWKYGKEIFVQFRNNWTKRTWKGKEGRWDSSRIDVDATMIFSQWHKKTSGGAFTPPDVYRNPQRKTTSF